MKNPSALRLLGAVLALPLALVAQDEQGSIRGVVRDKDFDVPLGGAEITILELAKKATSADLGNYVLGEVPPGRYTLVFAKDGYVRQVKADVVVTARILTEVDAALSGDFTEMERLLRQIMAAKPDYHHAYNALGYSFAERNLRLPEARQLIQKALEYAPGDPYISDSLGWVEFRLGNKAEAVRILETAYKAKPDAEIAAHLGEVLWSMGQRDRAQSIWREGLLLNNENDTLQETLKRLKVKP